MILYLICLTQDNTKQPVICSKIWVKYFLFIFMVFWCYYIDMAAPCVLFLSVSQQNFFSHFSVLNPPKEITRWLSTFLKTHKGRVSFWENWERLQEWKKLWSEGKKTVGCGWMQWEGQVFGTVMDSSVSHEQWEWLLSGSLITTTHSVFDHRRWGHDKKS